MEEGETKDRLVRLIANHMKRSYLAWNKSQVTDEVIFKDMKVLSQGKLEIKEDLVLTDIRQLLSKPRKKRTNLQKSNIQKKKN